MTTISCSPSRKRLSFRTPVATLHWWRHLGIGPHTFKVGRRVFYRLSDILAWLDQQHGQQSA
jgi:hypothetical protein